MIEEIARMYRAVRAEVARQLADDQPPTGERCELTDLFVDQCAHCRGVPDLPEPRRHRRRTDVNDRVPNYGRYVPARWPGECADCGQPFEENDQIRSNGQGGWVGECCEDADEPQ